MDLKGLIWGLKAVSGAGDLNARSTGQVVLERYFKVDYLRVSCSACCHAATGSFLVNGTCFPETYTQTDRETDG